MCSIPYIFRNLLHDPVLQLKEILSASLLDFLLEYDYPGNIKELLSLTRFFFTKYSGHPLILSQLPCYIRTTLKKPLSEQSLVRKAILSAIAASPRIGRSSIRKTLAVQGTELSDGKLRGLLKELSEEGLIRVNRTKGGCEITELGMASIF